MHDLERLAAMFAALGNRSRLALVDAMAQAGPSSGTHGSGLTITALAAQTELSRFSASHHLTILRECGLVEVTRTGSSALHRLNSDAADEIDDWLFPLLLKREPATTALDAPWAIVGS